ncbi:unnamed protein product, partial [Protopolystoma xenopodis]
MVFVVNDTRIDYQAMAKAQERERSQIAACHWLKLTMT